MPYNAQHKIDCKLGESAEVETLPKLNQFFGVKLERLDHYNKFDYMDINNNTLIELKTRRATKDKYSTTMIPLIKIAAAKQIKATDPNCKIIFSFNFTDGLYYIEYDIDKFNNYKIASGGRCDRGFSEQSIYCYIPTAELIKINSYKYIDPALKMILK